MEYLLSYGLGGSFGGANNHQTEELDNLEEALEYAEELARDYYQSYEGMHGLMSWSEVKKQLLEEEAENDISDEDVECAYAEEVERWIVFDAKPYDENKHSDLL